MKGFFVALMVLFLAVSMLAGWTDPAFADQTTWHGYVIDRQCANAVRHDSDPKAFVRHHTKDCSLMPNCRGMGYSMYSENKWFDLDKKANALVIKVLQASKRKNGLYVEVAGALRDKVLKVQSIKEIDEPQADDKESK